MATLLLFIQMFIANYFGGVGTYAPMDSQTVIVKGTKADGTEGYAIIQGRNNPIIVVGDYD
jgi:hypothetical protein